MKNHAFWVTATALSSAGSSRLHHGKGDEGRMPDLDGAVAWLNSSPLSTKALRGKVVVVNFWTYSCINSLRELPYLKAWAAKYKGAGLVVIGVHAPEFGFEKDPGNVKTAISGLKDSHGEGAQFGRTGLVSLGEWGPNRQIITAMAMPTQDACRETKCGNSFLSKSAPKGSLPR